MITVTDNPTQVSNVLTATATLTNVGSVPIYLDGDTSVSPLSAGLILAPRQSIVWAQGQPLWVACAPGESSKLSVLYGGSATFSPIVNVDGIVNATVSGDVTATIDGPVTVDAINGPVTVTGGVAVQNIVDANVSGNVSVSSISGAVTVGSVTAPVTVDSVTGPVTVTGAVDANITGPVSVSSISGAVTVGSVTAPVTVDSVTGPVTVTGAVDANITGPVTATITGPVDADITGPVTVNGAVAVQQTADIIYSGSPGTSAWGSTALDVSTYQSLIISWINTAAISGSREIVIEWRANAGTLIETRRYGFLQNIDASFKLVTPVYAPRVTIRVTPGTNYPTNVVLIGSSEKVAETVTAKPNWATDDRAYYSEIVSLASTSGASVTLSPPRMRSGMARLRLTSGATPTTGGNGVRVDLSGTSPGLTTAFARFVMKRDPYDDFYYDVMIPACPFTITFSNYTSVALPTIGYAITYL